MCNLKRFRLILGYSGAALMVAAALVSLGGGVQSDIGLWVMAFGWLLMLPERMAMWGR